MADVLTKTQRSYNMSRIKNKNTKPEIVVRKIIHGMGYRYGLHRKDLPGKPDIVLPRHKKIVLVSGICTNVNMVKSSRRLMPIFGNKNDRVMLKETSEIFNL